MYSWTETMQEVKSSLDDSLVVTLCRLRANSNQYNHWIQNTVLWIVQVSAKKLTKWICRQYYGYFGYIT